MKPVQAVQRAVRVLEAVAKSPQGVGVRELSARLKIPPATVSRLLYTLEQHGLVVQGVFSQEFRLGARVVWLSTQFLDGTQLQVASGPVLRDIRDRCGETVSLSVRDQDARLCVACQESTHIIRRALTVGERLPVYAGASGKVLLAFTPESEMEHLWREISLKLSDAGKSPDQLWDELSRVRKQGYAVSMAERVPDAGSVAAPVYDAGAQVIAALAISAPLSRFSVERQGVLVQMVVEGAARISRAMGHPGVAATSADGSGGSR